MASSDPAATFLTISSRCLKYFSGLEETDVQQNKRQTCSSVTPDTCRSRRAHSGHGGGSAVCPQMQLTWTFPSSSSSSSSSSFYTFLAFLLISSQHKLNITLHPQTSCCTESEKRSWSSKYHPSRRLKHIDFCLVQHVPTHICGCTLRVALCPLFIDLHLDFSTQ